MGPNVGDNCVAWSVVIPLAMGPGFVPGTWTGFLEFIPYGGILCSALIQGGSDLVLP